MVKYPNNAIANRLEVKLSPFVRLTIISTNDKLVTRSRIMRNRSTFLGSIAKWNSIRV